MDIKPVYNDFAPVKYNNKPQTSVDCVKKSPDSPKKQAYKNPAYITAGVALAGLGIYVFRNKLAKLLNLKNLNKAQPDIHSKVNESVKKQNFLPVPVQKEKFVCIGFKDGKPLYEKLENIVEKNVQPAKSAFKEAKDGLNLLNDEIIAKIIKIKNEHNPEIDKIIKENTDNGQINLEKIKNLVHNISSDERIGADRFHQAAELLEQSYIRKFIKNDGVEKRGIYNLYDFMKTDSELFSIYTQMPAEEAANRLNYIRYNDLLPGGVEKDMTPDMFFEKMFERLVEKMQFKTYNEAHAGTVVKVGV